MELIIFFRREFMKIPAINSVHRSRVIYYHNRYNSKCLFDELAVGAEHLTNRKDKVFLPRIISIKKPGFIKIG